MANGTAGTSLRRNTVLNAATQVVTALSPLIVIAVAARALGPTLVGRYTYLAWLAALLTTTATLGLPSTVTRFLAQLGGAGNARATRRLLMTSLQLTAVASCCLAGAAVAGRALHIVPTSTTTPQLLLVATLVPVSALTLVLTASLMGRQQFAPLLRVSGLTTTATLMASVVVLAVAPSVSWLLAAALVGGIVGLIVTFVYARPAGASGKLDASVRREIVRYAVPTSVIVVLDLIVWQRSEVFFLERYSTSAAVAFYAVAYTLVSRVMTLISSALSGVLLPRLSEQHGADEHDAAGRTFRVSFHVVTVATVPVIVAGLLFAGDIVHVLYGPGFTDAIPVLRVLLVSGGAAAIASVPAAALYSTGRQNIVLMVASVLAVVNVTLDLWLIPRHGYVGGAFGAAIANGAAQLVGVAVGVGYVVRAVDLPVPVRTLGRVGAVAAVAAGPAALTLLLPVSYLAHLVVGAAAYIAIYVMLLVRFDVAPPISPLALITRVRPHISPANSTVAADAPSVVDAAAGLDPRA